MILSILGGFGEVYKVYREFDENFYAIKKVKLDTRKKRAT